MKKTTREKLLELHAGEPHLNQTMIAERLGVSRQRISALVAQMGLKIEAGPRGISGRRDPDELAANRRLLTARARGEIVAPPGLSADSKILLAAADLARRGYAVFLPMNPSRARCDLVTIDERDRVEQVVVSSPAKPGDDVRYDTPENARKLRRVMIMSDRPVEYSPALRPKE
jgi:hypothetical protein